MKCTNCDSTNIYWSGQITRHNNARGIVDGKLRIHDLETIVVLGCEECAETLSVVPLDLFLEDSNALLRRQSQLHGLHSAGKQV